MVWGEALRKALNAPKSEPGNKVMMRLARDTSSELKLRLLDETIASLKRDFGRWQLPWGELNRFQRISPAIHPSYSDLAPSLPVPFAEGRYGSLASIRSEPKPGTKRWYGDYGNSFVAGVALLSTVLPADSRIDVTRGVVIALPMLSLVLLSGFAG